MKLPRWIQRTLDALPNREAVMAENKARQIALDSVECLRCKGKPPRLTWLSSLDEDVIECLNCGPWAQIVRKL